MVGICCTCKKNSVSRIFFLFELILLLEKIIINMSNNHFKIYFVYIQTIFSYIPFYRRQIKFNN